MKKTVGFLVVLLIFILLSVPSMAEDPSPHPDPYSGDLSNYEGKWIINGKTEENTNWTLEIKSDGTYHLQNKY